MKIVFACLLVMAFAGCGSVARQMEAREEACAARGGVLTGMGCQGGGGFQRQATPGRIDSPPPTDRYGQPNFNERGEYVGGHGEGLLVDRPPGEPAAPTPMPSNVTCTRNAAGNAANCTSL